MDSTNDRKAMLFKMRKPDGTYNIVRLTMPASVKMDEFLEWLKKRQNKAFVPLSANETADYAVSSHKEIGELRNELKRLNEAFNNVKKIVMDQDQNKPQKDQETDTNAGHSDQPPKKTKLEEQNEEIEKLNQIIKDLKKDAQKHTEVIKNLKEDNIKLYTEVTGLKYGGQ